MRKIIPHFGLIAVSTFVLQFCTTLQSPLQNKTCSTAECQRAAQNFKESIDVTTNPCDDFYQFACGDWPKNHPNIKKFSENSTLQIRTEKNNKELSEFIKSNITENEPKAVQKLKKSFLLCLNAGKNSEKETQAIENILRQSGIPEELPEKYQENQLDIPAILAKTHKTFGQNNVFVLAPAPNPNNETENILTLSPFSDYEIGLIDNPKTRMFLQKMLQAETFGRKCSFSNLEFCETWKRVAGGFQDILPGIESTTNTTTTNTTTTSEERENDGKDNTTILSLTDLQNLTDIARSSANTSLPSFNWTQYISVLYEDIKDVSLDFSKPSDIKIAIPMRGYAERVIKRLHSFDNILRVWNNTKYKLKDQADILKPTLQLGENITATKNNRREGQCFSYCNKHTFALSYYYASNLEHKKIKNEVSEMVVNIKEVLKKLIEEADWMDEETKKKAIEKLRLLKSYVAYPKSVENPVELDAYYEDWEVTDTFLESYAKTEANIKRKELRLLNQLNKVDKKNIKVPPSMVNAFYSPETNTIIIPAGILGAPIYESSLRALVYGSIGIVVGHEVTHGFDNTGAKYNGTGDLEEWWNPKTLEEYKKRARCYRNAYSNYSETFKNFTFQGNSNRTLGEDIADNDGFKEALLAYRNYVVQNGAEPLLLAFENYTHEQLFTLSFANVWCENPSMGFSKGSHSPNSVRVNGVLRNSEEFAKIWNCPKGSNMNPNVEKCVMF